jgi:CHASE3 domain sensor protein
MQLPVLVSILCVAGLNYAHMRSLTVARELVTHSLVVHNGIEAVLSTIQDVEVGQRGYLLTGNASYLEPYESVVAKAMPMVTVLGELVRDNSNQRVLVERAKTLIDAKLAEVTATIELAKQGKKDAAIALVMTDVGKRNMDELRQLVSEMKQTENALLDDRLAGMKANDQRVLVVAGLAVALTILGRFFAFLIQLRHRRQRRVKLNRAGTP